VYAVGRSPRGRSGENGGSHGDVEEMMRSGGRWSSVGRRQGVSRPLGWAGGGGFDTPLRGYSTHGGALRGHLRTQPAEGVLCADPTGGDGTAEPVGRVPREARCIETARVGAWQRGIRRCAATQPAGGGTAEPVGRVPAVGRCIETARVGAWQRGFRYAASRLLNPRGWGERLPNPRGWGARLPNPRGWGELRGYPRGGELRG
jgi:hypothetical protein